MNTIMIIGICVVISAVIYWGTIKTIEYCIDKKIKRIHERNERLKAMEE